MLNKNTFFGITEINEHFETPSAIHVIYGDCEYFEHFICSKVLNCGAQRSLICSITSAENTEEAIDSAGLSLAQFEAVSFTFLS